MSQAFSTLAVGAQFISNGEQFQKVSPTEASLADSTGPFAFHEDTLVEAVVTLTSDRTLVDTIVVVDPE